jgi:hypothetical protein
VEKWINYVEKSVRLGIFHCIINRSGVLYYFKADC